YQQLGDASGEADALSNLGASALALKRYQEALVLCQQALPLHQQLRNPSSEQLTWDTLGQAQLALGKPQEALTAFQKSIALVEQRRGGLESLAEAKTDTLAASLPTYSRAIALLHKLGRDEEAFLLVQQTKGRALAERGGQAQPELMNALTVAEQAQRGLLQEQASFLNFQLIAEGVRNEPGSKKRFAELGEQLKGVEVQRATLEDQLSLRHPTLARLRPRLPIASKAIAAQLPANTALIEYVLAEKPLAFVVTKNGLSVHALPTSLPSLTRQIAALQSACQSEKKETKSAVRTLVQSLVAPLAKPLAHKTRLIICPDGTLWDIPFALLFPQLTVSLAHSATLWRGDSTVTSPKILVYANPELGTQGRFTLCPIITPDRPIKTPDRPIKTPDRPIKTPDRDLVSKLEDATERAGALSALPGADSEAKAIARHFPGAVIRRAGMAQEASFTREAGQFSLLHLASHAFLNNAAPMLSCLVLATPSLESSDDGFLTAREILSLELNAELVVLSACNTGQGEKQPSEGVIGLSWAFLAAGARQLVVTQWSVNDEATARFMDYFYAALKAKKSPAVALQDASRALQKIPRWRHPHYWAGFALITRN
uniref:CHAT domain-containing protein n=1 Tax=Armatimonas sp. TaxID=1872638 RepID=UPI00286A12E2